MQLFNNEIMQSRNARLTRYLESSFTALGHSQGCIQTGSSGTELMSVGKAAALEAQSLMKDGLNAAAFVSGLRVPQLVLGTWLVIFHHVESCTSPLHWNVPSLQLHSR